MKKIVGFRKLIMVGVFFAVATNFVNDGKIDPDLWMTEMVKLLIAFVGANLAEHAASAGKTYIQEKSRKLDTDLIATLNKDKK